MDGSPIIDRTPTQGLYLNAGWCYGGFKATPASGWCLAHLIAKDEPHPVAAAYRLNRFATGHLIDEKGAGASAEPSLNQGFKRCASPAPIAEPETSRSSPTSAMRTSSGPARAKCPEAAMRSYVYERDNPAGRQREYWHHSAGCQRLDRRHPRYQDASDQIGRSPAKPSVQN